jgi:hypothetical protein
MAAPAGARELLLAIRGTTILLFDPSSGSAEALITFPNGPVDIVAQDRVRHRLFIESFEPANAPFYFSLWVFDVQPIRLVKTPFRAKAMQQYFYDDYSDTLFALEKFSGHSQIMRIDLQSGSTSSVMVLPDSPVLNNLWGIASYDQILRRLYLIGVVDTRAEFSEKALFVANLNDHTLTQSPFHSWDALSFLPHSDRGELYALVARGVSSEIQEFDLIKAATGTSEPIIQSLHFGSSFLWRRTQQTVLFFCAPTMTGKYSLLISPNAHSRPHSIGPRA